MEKYRINDKHKIKNINTLFLIWISIFTILFYILFIINSQNILFSFVWVLLITIVVFYIFINLYN